MEIKITKAVSMKKGQPLISFTSEYGKSEALCLDDVSKMIGSIDVEISFGSVCNWLVDVHPTHEKHPRLEKLDKVVRIIAEIESIAEDGCSILKLGNSRILTEIRNIPNLPTKTFIELKPRFITISSTNL